MALLVNTEGVLTLCSNATVALADFMEDRFVHWLILESVPMPMEMKPWEDPSLVGDSVRDEHEASCRRDPKMWRLNRVAVIDEEGLLKEAYVSRNKRFRAIIGPVLFYAELQNMWDSAQVKQIVEEQESIMYFELLDRYISEHPESFCRELQIRI